MTFSAASQRGACADGPTRLGRLGWRDVLKRVWINSGREDINLMAGGVAFFGFLSFVPLLAALLMTYGLFADPGNVADLMRWLTSLVPPDAARLIERQLAAIAQSAAAAKGLKLLLALAVAIYGATRASWALMGSLNRVYQQEEGRSFLRGTMMSFLLILGFLVLCLAGLVAASVVGYLEAIVGRLGPAAAAVLHASAWLGAAAVCSLTFALMYRYAPDREDARWQWLSLGAVVATLLWLAASWLFGLYAANFGHYDATYGSLSAVVVLLMWMYVSAYAILLGGFINAEAERQTARDSTTGPPRPMGSRGATVADMSAALQP